MVLDKLSTKEIERAAELLADYWKERGMPEYDRLWAEEYLIQGHRKEIKEDEFFVDLEDGKMTGVISLVTYAGDVAEIRDMVVDPRLRKKGYGKKMLDEIVGIAKHRKIRKLYALVFAHAEPIYSSAGFEKEAVLKSHFADGEDLSVMSLFL